MRIVAIDLHAVPVEMAYTYKLSMGRTESRLDSSVVRVETDSGLVGWGEVCPFGRRYSEAFPEAAREAIKAAAPALIGIDPRAVGIIGDRMAGELSGHLYATSALELACWDILGRAAGLPLCDLLGGRRNERVPAAASVHSQDLDAMLDHLERLRAEGFVNFSPKIDGAKGAAEFEKFRTIAESRRPGETMTIDANTSLSQAQAAQLANMLRGTGAMLEQPCRTYEACRAVRRQSDLPMVLDECIESPLRLYQALADDAIDLLNLKISRIGGLTVARHMVEVCAHAGIGVMIEETAGTEISAAAIAHLAAATPSAVCVGAWYPPEFNRTRLCGGGPTFENGHITLAGEAPGLGVEPDPALLGAPVASFG